MNPKITVVTPSFNQGRFIEQTILSVINQNYENLEYFIFDGGSNDETIDIIKKYENKITYWESKKDNGQADAIMKGFEKATGEIICWLNSDDIFLKDSLNIVSDYFKKNKDEYCLIGSTLIIDEKSSLKKHFNFIPFFSVGSITNFKKLLFYDNNFNQPSTFYRKSEFFLNGAFDKNLRFCFDLDMFLNLSKKRNLAKTTKILSAFRIHDKSKTSTIQNICENEKVLVLNKHGRNNYNSFFRGINYCFYFLQNYINKYFFLLMNAKYFNKKSKELNDYK